MARDPVSKRWRVRLAWLVVYWAAGVATAAVVAFALKSVMRAAGLGAQLSRRGSASRSVCPGR